MKLKLKLHHVDKLILILFPLHLSHSLCSLALSPFTVMEYFIDILGVGGRAMTLQLFYPFQMHYVQ